MRLASFALALSLAFYFKWLIPFFRTFMEWMGLTLQLLMTTLPCKLQWQEELKVFCQVWLFGCPYEAQNLYQSLKRLFHFQKVNVYTLPLYTLISTAYNVNYIFKKLNIYLSSKAK